MDLEQSNHLVSNKWAMIRKQENSLLVNSKKNQDSISTKTQLNSLVNKTGIDKHNQFYYLKKKKSMIYINPKKLSTSQAEKQLKVTDNVKQHSQLDVEKQSKTHAAKVYINPYFKKSSTLLLPQDQLKKINSKTEMANLELRPIQYSLKRNDTCQSSLVTHHLQSSRPPNSIKKNNIPVNPVDCNLATNNHSIFVNPEFNKQNEFQKSTGLLSKKGTKEDEGSKCDIYMDNLTPQLLNERVNVNFKPFSKVLSSSLTGSTSLEISRKNTSSKRKIYLNQYKTEEKASGVTKRRKSGGKTIPVKQIFINPKFENKMQESKVVSNIDSVKNEFNDNPKNVISMQGISGVSFLSMSTEKKALMDSQKFGITSIPVSPLTVKTHFEQIYQKKNTIANPGQRLRSRSTSLVSVSPTKLIRKRRNNTFQQNIKTTNQPVFLSKTKLVRYSTVKETVGLTNDNTVATNKVKPAIPKVNLQCLTPDKTSKLRKQSFTNGIKSLVNIVPKSANVTRVKSKNGKSLKVIRKSLEIKTHVMGGSATTNTNILQKQKNLLRQQARKNALCILQNKLRKSQFSKINIPMKNNTSQYFTPNKYVYKKKYINLQKFSNKISVVDRKLKSSFLRGQSSKSPLDRPKFVRSKYSFIKQQAFSDGKFVKTPKNISHKLLQTCKRKWKSQNNLANRNAKRKELSIVNIGGVFYRCSRTSLTRNKTTSKQNSQKQSKGPLLHIRGQKFQFDNNGQTLTCLDEKPGRKRIDIGGVTFISSSSGTSLTRTNYHTARSILLQAKQKSISLLTRKLKKNNEPCPFFHRLGRCSGNEKGTCVRQHDPRYVVVCKKFVQGSCSDIQCLLSHVVSCHNMPTCQHFLAGHCGRDNCPYPHIKVNDNAPLCINFLKGYCILGDQCAKRHLEICPSFEKGTCARGKYCPYPHPKSKSTTKLKGKLKYLKNKPQPLRSSESVSSSSVRYFENVNLQKENEIQLINDSETPEEKSAGEEERSCPLRNRPRLGRLPSFIPLSLDNSSESNTQET